MTLTLEVESDPDGVEFHVEDWADWSGIVVARIGNTTAYRHSLAPGTDWATLWNNAPRSIDKKPLPYWTDLLTLDQFICWKGEKDEEEAEQLEVTEEWESTREERRNWIANFFRWTGHYLVEMDDDDLEGGILASITVIIMPNISDEERLLRAYRKQSLPEEIIVLMAEQVAAIWRGEVWWWHIKDEEGEIHDSCGGYTDFDYAQSEGQASLEYLLKTQTLTTTEEKDDGPTATT